MYTYDNTNNNLLKINPYNGSTTSIPLPSGSESPDFGYNYYSYMQYSVHEGDMYFFTANTMSMGTRMLKINTQDEISEIESDGSITSGNSPPILIGDYIVFISSTTPTTITFKNLNTGVSNTVTNHDLKFVNYNTITDNGDFYFTGQMQDNSYKLYSLSNSNIASGDFSATELYSDTNSFDILTTDGTNVYYRKRINNISTTFALNNGVESILPIPENVTAVSFYSFPYSRVNQYNGKIFAELYNPTLNKSYYAFYDPSDETYSEIPLPENYFTSYNSTTGFSTFTYDNNFYFRAYKSGFGQVILKYNGTITTEIGLNGLKLVDPGP